MSKMCVLNYTLCFIGYVFILYKYYVGIINVISNHCTTRNDTTNIQKCFRKTK